jgi:uncharacterized membrane protein
MPQFIGPLFRGFMMARDVALTLLLTILPISELRGGIPLGISLGLDPVFTLCIAVVANGLIFFPIFFGLGLFYDRLLSRIPLFDRYLESVRRRGKPKVEKYGFWGLLFFVAIPLPMTGVYTATSLAWLLQFDRRKAFLPIAIGVVIAGVVVLLATLGVVEAFRIFVKT